jgi:hypothetical protein
MTVKAVCCMNSITRDSDNHAHFVAAVSYAGLVDTSIQGTHYVYDLDPSAIGTDLTNTIQAAMKVFLTGEGITFGVLDSVRLLPGLI